MMRRSASRRYEMMHDEPTKDLADTIYTDQSQPFLYDQQIVRSNQEWVDLGAVYINSSTF